MSCASVLPKNVYDQRLPTSFHMEINIWMYVCIHGRTVTQCRRHGCSGYDGRVAVSY